MSSSNEVLEPTPQQLAALPDLIAVAQAIVKRYRPYGSPSEGTDAIYAAAVRACHKAGVYPS